MTFTVETLSKSLANYLAPYFPGVTFYEDPVQQGTDTPCMFLQTRTNQITLHTSGRYLRTLGLDLIYLEDFDLPNLQRLYQKALETLDEVMETFPYSDGSDSCLIRAYNRNGNVDEDSAHYNFEIRIWVKPHEESTPMQTLTYQEEILNE